MGGIVTVSNSTLSGNVAQGGLRGAGTPSGSQNGSAFGGAIFNRNGTVTVLNSTITNNTAANGATGIYNLGDAATATAVLNNTLIGQASTAVTDFVGTTINGASGISTTSGVGNLIRTATGFSGTVVSTNDPNLAALADNGGPTFTHALNTGSPALDVGDNAAASALTTDQRGTGFARISNTTIDIGAFEFVLPTVTGTSPSFATSGTLPAGTTSLQVSFSQPMNATAAADSTKYELRRAGPNGLLGEPSGIDDVIVPLTASYNSGSNSTTLTFTALPEDVYRLTVRDTLTDVSSGALDGDNNGTAGGDFVRDFVVTETGTRDGQTASTAGLSALQILNDGYSVGNGIYWLDPDGVGANAPFQAYADMTRDGGGWTLGLKTWYQAGHYRNPNAVGNVADGLTLKGNPYKLSDTSIQQLIGASNNFDVMVDQAGFNQFYSTGNYEYAVLRNYTGAWTWQQAMPASSTQTLLQSYQISDNALAWSGELLFGAGGAGINGSVVLRGPGRLFQMGTISNPGWHHFSMAETNTDSYLYLSNGAQHSSGVNMNHRFWFRETTLRDTSLVHLSPSSDPFEIDPSQFGAGQLGVVQK